MNRNVNSVSFSFGTFIRNLTELKLIDRKSWNNINNLTKILDNIFVLCEFNVLIFPKNALRDIEKYLGLMNINRPLACVAAELV